MISLDECKVRIYTKAVPPPIIFQRMLKVLKTGRSAGSYNCNSLNNAV